MGSGGFVKLGLDEGAILETTDDAAVTKDVVCAEVVLPLLNSVIADQSVHVSDGSCVCDDETVDIYTEDDGLDNSVSEELVPDARSAEKLEISVEVAL